MEGKQTVLLIFSAVLIDCFQTGVTLRFVVDCCPTSRVADELYTEDGEANIMLFT